MYKQYIYMCVCVCVCACAHTHIYIQRDREIWSIIFCILESSSHIKLCYSLSSPLPSLSYFIYLFPLPAAFNISFYPSLLFFFIFADLLLLLPFPSPNYFLLPSLLDATVPNPLVSTIKCGRICLFLISFGHFTPFVSC